MSRGEFVHYTERILKFQRIYEAATTHEKDDGIKSIDTRKLEGEGGRRGEEGKEANPKYESIN